MVGGRGHDGGGLEQRHPRRRRRHRCLHEGHRPRRRRTRRVRLGGPAPRPGRSTPPPSPRRRPGRCARGARATSPPARTRSCSTSRRSGSCSSCSAAGVRRARPHGGPQRAVGAAGTRVAAPSINLSDMPRFTGSARHGPSTPRACPRRRSRSSRTGWPTTSFTTPARPRPPGRDPVDRPRRGGRAAPRTGRPRRNLVLVGGGAASASTSSPADRARDLRDPPLVREPGVAEGHAPDRHDARRHLPDRGRPDHAPAARRAVHRLGPAASSARVEALGDRPRLVSEGEFYGRRFATGNGLPRAAGRRVPRHRLDGADARREAPELRS